MPDWVDQSVAEQEEFLNDAIERVRCRAAGTPAPETENVECLDCGGEIPKKRLALVPGARRCVKCAESFERKRGRAT